MDACPEVAGDRANNGCPEDADGDGIINTEDECPQEAGPASNNGCPEPEKRELEEEVRQDLENIIERLQFNVNSSNINLELSVNRANAVKDYLVQQGVQAGRIAAFGYGETRPIASNDTQEGRERNRRVELDLYYQE